MAEYSHLVMLMLEYSGPANSVTGRLLTAGLLAEDWQLVRLVKEGLLLVNLALGS